MKKKILIIGNSAKEYALAKKLSLKHEVYVTPSSDMIKEFATCIDIREDKSSDLLEFVMENGIDLTIPVSTMALKSDIVELFNKNNQAIFAHLQQFLLILLQLLQGLYLNFFYFCILILSFGSDYFQAFAYFLLKQHEQVYTLNQL